MSYDFKNLEKLIRLAKKHKLAEMSVENGKTKVHFQFRSSQVVNVTTASAVSATQDLVSLKSHETKGSQFIESNDDSTNYHKVLSPFVGTFYRSPSPESEPYASEGQMVRKGDVLCIIEAMKLMNEIESEVSGKIVSVLVQNAQAVEYGEPLFLIEPL